MSSDYKKSFEPLVVLQFSSKTPLETKEWVIRRLTADHNEDQGAGLLAQYETSPESGDNMIVIGAKLSRLLIGAEELRIKKRYKNKGLTEFLISDIDRFENSENPENFLLQSEKQRIIWEEIQTLHPMSNEHSVPGVPTKMISPKNDTLLDILHSLDFIANIFPLHDKEDIKLMEHDWFKSIRAIFKPQDIHRIRNYFGENVAFYFAFLEYYTWALVPTAILGFLINFWPVSDFFKYSFLCFFIVIWWTVFMELWKNYTNRLASQWGTLDGEMFERPRSLYYGEPQLSPITNKEEPYYPAWKHRLKKYFISYPLMMICLIISLTIYFNYCRIQNRTDAKYPFDGSLMFIQVKAMRMFPSIVYSLLIGQVNLNYRKLATFLTDNENHRLQTSYENNLTAKLFIFFFVNCFVGLFYQAFFMANYGNVTQLLTSMLIVNVVILKFTEQIGPYISKRLKKKQLVESVPTDARLSNSVKQLKTLLPFQGTYGDYLTIFEQYGYVALFSAVFPWITICAVINNFYELRADAFKYCYVYRRPFAQPAWNIGSWHCAFDILSSIAIVTNTALIAMQPSVRQYFSSYNDVEYILIFVAAEHVLLAMKLAIDFAIPDVPVEVEIERVKNLYESNQALRSQRSNKTLQAQKSITSKH
ncbi:unnamed protein product [Rotaria magnacalcarata]|uniref:Anoctamin n=1 Tax=Rotaria magnacalcarata TaxID=392030 RepID=A0A816UHF6_9BILA|nr:unnamed protein product [Rotaria magnacalcarata]